MTALMLLLAPTADASDLDSFTVNFTSIAITYDERSSAPATVDVGFSIERGSVEVELWSDGALVVAFEVLDSDRSYADTLAWVDSCDAGRCADVELAFDGVAWDLVWTGDGTTYRTGDHDVIDDEATDLLPPPKTGSN